MKTVLKTSMFLALFAIAATSMASGLHDYDGLPSAVHAAGTAGDNTASPLKAQTRLIPEEYNSQN